VRSSDAGDETIALAALIQATVVKLYKLHTQNQASVCTENRC